MAGIPDLNLGGGAGLHGDEAILLARAVNAIRSHYTAVVAGGAANATLTATGVLATDEVISAVYHDNVTPAQVDVTADTTITGDDEIQVDADTSDGNVVLTVGRSPLV